MNDVTIPAIETHWDGYRFRSRIEARWAVFFRSLGWGYAYEPEGFVLASGRRYLPDFYLPAFDLWVEIKGAAPTQEEVDMLGEFAAAGKRCILLYGTPSAEEHGVFFGCADPAHRYDAHYAGAMFARCRRCPDGIYLRTVWEGSYCITPCPPTCTTMKEPLPTPDIYAAYQAAKSARFEHGEQPMSTV